MEGRFAVFNSFQIKGAGGSDHMELAAQYGANTIRTWIVNDETQILLDRAKQLQQKMILGVWMPHQGLNGRKGDGGWNFDYQKKRGDLLAELQTKLDQYDSHSALLMWGLGNEVHLDEPYLNTVNEMAKLIHQQNPNRLTCIVIINAPQASIDLIKQHAPEVDMIGVNAYSRGAMQTAINNLETHWQKPYFFSEYSYRGPWSAAKAVTDHNLELTTSAKVKQLREANPMIEVGENNMGGVVFVWGQFDNAMGTWFSLLLPEDPTRTLKPNETPLVTAMGDEMHRYWKGSEPSNRAPVIERMTLNDSDQGIEFAAHSQLTVAVTASDADDDPLTYRYWFFRVRGEVKGKKVAGPIQGSSTMAIQTPDEPGEYRLLCQVYDDHGKVATHHLPLRVFTDSTGISETE
jgi:hypothetical protein